MRQPVGIHYLLFRRSAVNPALWCLFVMILFAAGPSASDTVCTYLI